MEISNSAARALRSFPNSLILHSSLLPHPLEHSHTPRALIASLIAAHSLPNEAPVVVGMIRLCCMSSTTGRKRWLRSNHTISSGIKWIRRSGNHTTSIGPSTSHRNRMHILALIEPFSTGKLLKSNGIASAALLVVTVDIMRNP